ncbi:MAG: hypothetical protein IJT87_02855 [Ruminiclostridium sp.]|nr:hypothetical protein [Ruminiclostridium sp.]
MKKKALSLLVVSCVILGMAGCNNAPAPVDQEDDEEETTTASTTTAAASDSKADGSEAPGTTPADEGNEDKPADESTEEWTVDYTNNTVYAGSASTKLKDTGSGTLDYSIYAGEAGKDYTDPKVYTYHDYIAEMNNMKWSTHTWETNEDESVLTYLSDGFYEFQLNSDKDGWAIACEMAAALPEDVTADYVGKYGISEGDKAKAFKIALNPDACWEDGTPINADSYIYSYRELLDPKMMNRRADSLYAGEFEIYGAKAYLYQGREAFTPIDDNISDWLAAGNDESTLYVDLSFWGVAKEDGTTYAPITDDTMIRDEGVEDETADEAYVSAKYLYDNYLSAGKPYADYSGQYLGQLESYAADYSFDDVGVIKTGDYELVFVSVSSMDQWEYYVPYHLTSVYLVYPALWESCKTYFNSNGTKVSADSPDVNSITTNYCTDAKTTMSFGPYRLSYFELDKQMTFERNENWYGYKDGKHTGQYQTDVVSVQVIGEQATALLAFQNGEIDGVSLVAADMAKYGSSDYIRYTPQSYTTKLTFNSDVTKTSERGSQIMCNPTFRKAFSLAIDRNKFATSYTAAGSAGYGILNYLYVYDPFTGATYRDTDGAKEALVHLYGLTYGEDGDFDDLDEAYEAITGYDPVKAQELMAQAYDECVASGLYDGSAKVELDLRVYQGDDVYVQMFNYLKGALEDACKGTGFEGKVTMTMTVDADYYETNYSGGADMIFTTWGGAAYSPWSMLYQSYCDASDGSGQQMEYGFDTSAVKVTMTLDGKKYTSDLQNWAKWASGDTKPVIKSEDGSETLLQFGDYDNQTKAKIFGKLEYSYLSFFVTTPIYYRNVGSLVSQKGDYAVKTYIDMVAFGDLRFFTYAYDDTEWENVRTGLTY